MASDKPRYSRVTDIVRMISMMSASPEGITIQDVEKEFSVKRRTAERMISCIKDSFHQIGEIETTDSHKHWGFINYRAYEMIFFTNDEIFALEQYKKRTTNKELKKHLNSITDKLKSLNTNKIKDTEEKIELMMQTEGYAIRQMPQYKIDLKILDVIRDALQNTKIITGIYHNKPRKLEPLGLIYGAKIYLVAREKEKGNDIYHYFLNKFEDLKTTGEHFDRGDFNLREYTNLSFGVYHGEILDVKLSFEPKLAEEASNYNFHPTQKGKFEKDGSYTLTFKACGNWEIMWHVFKWGPGCKIISPKSLKDEYINLLKENLKNYK